MSVNDCQIIYSPNWEKILNSKICNVGVDEAGRGPVLGPMVYGIAVSPVSDEDKLKMLGVDDSKALTDCKREEIINQIESTNDYFGYIVKVLSPNHLSRTSLARVKYNLNDESHDACMELIRYVVNAGIRINEVFVDTVGPPIKYQEKLAQQFPNLCITVAKKADSLYPVVSAASIAAKVTRDRLVSNWQFPENRNGYQIAMPIQKWGSGYPGDPMTKEFLATSIDPVFGYSTFVRFDWQTTKTILADKRNCVQVTWEDDEMKGNKCQSKSLHNYFGKRKFDTDADCQPTKVVRHVYFQDRCINSVTSF